jgi:hypothetical protein
MKGGILMADEPDDLDPDDEAEPQGEMFPAGVLDGDGRTLKTLIRPGLPVELTCSIGKAEVPLRGGLPDPDKPVRALVTAVFHKAEPIAIRDPDAPKVTGWKLRAHMRADFVETVPGTDQGLIEQRFRALLEVDANAAAGLLDSLQKMASEVLATA